MRILFPLTWLIIASIQSASALQCVYSIQPDKLKVEWTAFKTTEKIAVKGTFKKVVFSGHNVARTVAALATGATIDIDAKTVESGNPARDANLMDAFFSKLAGDSKIQGRLDNLELNGELPAAEGSKGSMTLKLNGKTQKIPFTAKIEKGAELETLLISGTVDLLDFKATSAVASLNKKCLELHKGKDGVSKTWSDVNFAVSVPFRKNCE